MNCDPPSQTLKLFLHAPVYFYRWHLGWMLGKRFLLLIHTGRRTGVRRRTVLEVLEYRPEYSEAVVMSGFGRDADWLRNIRAREDEEIVIAARHFCATHRFLGEDEAIRVIESYERKNRWIAPLVRYVLSRLLGWRYHGTEAERRRLVEQLPLIAFRPARAGRRA